MRDNPIVASAVDARHSNASPPASPAKASGASPQPSFKLNSVAHEVAVVATGARPGKNGGQRELFTEETATVLVFENGGVLRLSAAVVPGQLLFLTNKATRREVVAQVTRKRDFRPTSCYVEVEFSEPSPGFWGLEFPELPQLPPANAQQEEAAELVHSAKVISGEPNGPVPSAQEVTALKHEVEALREQLKLLQTQTAPASVSAPPVAPDPPHVPAAPEAHAEQAPNLPSAASEAPASKPAIAPRVSGALPPEPGGPSFSEETHLPKPVIRVNRKTKSQSFSETERNERRQCPALSVAGRAAFRTAFARRSGCSVVPALDSLAAAAEDYFRQRASEHRRTSRSYRECRACENDGCPLEFREQYGAQQRFYDSAARGFERCSTNRA
jgi:hypothetical protein